MPVFVFIAASVDWLTHHGTHTNHLLMFIERMQVNTVSGLRGEDID